MNNWQGWPHSKITMDVRSEIGADIAMSAAKIANFPT
jgi:hypothetical protein